MLSCKLCGKSFTRRDNLIRHENRFCKSQDSVLCDQCGLKFSNQENLQKHLNDRHNTRKRKFELIDSSTTHEDGPPAKDVNVICEQCQVSIPRSRYAAHCRSLKHKGNVATPIGGSIEKIQLAYNSRMSLYRVRGEKAKQYVSVKDFMYSVKDDVINLVNTMIDKYGAVKVNFELFGLYILASKESEEVKSFNTRNEPLYDSSNLENVYDKFQDVIDNKASEFQEKDSGWALQKILYLEVHINKLNPMKASSYIELPKSIEKRKAVTNIQNNDNQCFKWCILAELHPIKKDAQRVSHYQKYKDSLNFEKIEFPIKLKDIPKFENLNNISVNVYGLEAVYTDNKTKMEVVGPLHHTTCRKSTHVNLLLIDDDNGNHHYCLIKDLSKLIGSQLSKNKNRKYLCDGCFAYFRDEQHLQDHEKYDCAQVRVTLPTIDPKIDRFGNLKPANMLKFESFEKKLKMPFVIYVDFEAALIPIENCKKDDSKAFTVKTHMHEPYSFAYYIKCTYDDSLSKLEVYRGPNVAETFCDRLQCDVLALYNNHLKHVIPMKPLTKEQEIQHQSQSNCHICEKLFQENEERVKDHDHESGEYRGPAHSNCNLNYKLPNIIPVFIHNLTNYDAHLFIKSLGLDQSKIEVIAENKEKYISFSKHLLVERTSDDLGRSKNKFMKIRFLDSFRFMPMSLENLAKNLTSEQCKEVRKYYHEEQKFNLIREKGIFPYSYIDNIDRLNNTKLPTREQFYNDLKGEEVSEAEYSRACTVWKLFECKTLGDYSDVYIKSDVLLLADVFENFRYVCICAYGLDPAQYFTAPSLSWDAMLKSTNIELELLTDLDMHSFIKKGIRGGISQCSSRKAVGNNKFLPNYDPSKKTSFICFQDFTNLYGAALSQFLPYGGFEWLREDDIKKMQISQIGKESTDGYIFEVDLEYPQNLHDIHNEMPYCCENTTPPGSKLKKLIPNLYNKERYVIHYSNLQQCIQAGLILKKVHRILKFKQSNWLKSYVELNTKMRNNASNTFERNFYKLMNNSVFGKTMENVDKRSDIRLVTHWENIGKRIGAQSLIAKPNFKTCSIFSETLVAIHMSRLKVTYDKPIYIGFCVLDISKFMVYDFYYNFIKQKYQSDVNLLYTDTDSLVMEIFTDNFYEDMKQDLDKYDTSNFKSDNCYGIPVNTSVIGKVKDEFGGRVIHSFYGTGAKAYCVNTDDGSSMKKAKGIPHSVIDKELNDFDYQNVVEHDDISIYRTMKSFRSEKHQLYTELINKVALSSKDDKRYVIPNSHQTLAWGHYKIDSVVRDDVK